MNFKAGDRVKVQLGDHEYQAIVDIVMPDGRLGVDVDAKELFYAEVKASQCTKVEPAVRFLLEYENGKTLPQYLSEPLTTEFEAHVAAMGRPIVDWIVEYRESRRFRPRKPSDMSPTFPDRPEGLAK